MKEFNLEEAKAGQPVCTRNGKPVRIICWDAKNDQFPIVALVSLDDGSEETECYTIDGKYDIDDLVWDRDLMMTSIKHESEDERIRKKIISLVENWKKYNPYSPFVDYPIYTSDAEEIDKILTWLEKQSEQNTTDKTESQFNVGDWVVNNIYKDIFLIKSVNSGYCTLEDTKGNFYSPCLPFESEFHLWTIDDAKDGDVLSDGTTIFIFKDLLSDGSVMSYCDYYTDSDESDVFSPSLMNLMCSKVTPATKEQRDLLFAKMKDAGYKWNDKKKKVRKIEHNVNSFIEEIDKVHQKFFEECVKSERNKNEDISRSDQIRDEARKWDCCSGDQGFIEGVKWSDENPIRELWNKEKVIYLLKRMIWDITYEDLEGNSTEHYDKMEFIEDLTKAIEE